MSFFPVELSTGSFSVMSESGGRFLLLVSSHKTSNRRVIVISCVFTCTDVKNQPIRNMYDFLQTTDFKIVFIVKAQAETSISK